MTQLQSNTSTPPCRDPRLTVVRLFQAQYLGRFACRCVSRVPFLSPGRAIFRDAGRQSLEEQPTMDKVVSLLILVGIITFGAWVTAATIAKGWPLVWMLMALFPLLTGFISLYGSIRGTED